MAWSPLQELVTLDQAKRSVKLSLEIDTDDEDLQIRLEVAHAMVMSFISSRVSGASDWMETMDSWTSDTVPRLVVGAILAQFGFLYRRRGDDDSRPPMSEGAAICPDAQQCLMSLRDPPVA
jgi:hypothetical protein